MRDPYNVTCLKHPWLTKAPVWLRDCQDCFDSAITAAERAAFRRGQEAMRERAAGTADDYERGRNAAHEIRALPLTAEDDAANEEGL